MKWRLLFLFLITFIVLQMPIVGIFLQAVNTMIHESGHAFATLISKGTVYDIQLFANTEGITRALLSNWQGGVFTALSGYIFASFFAYLLAVLWSHYKDHWVLALLLILSTINLIFWIRNIYGIVWVSIFIILLFILLRLRNDSIRHGATFIIIAIAMMDSVRSALIILLLSIQQPHAAGDATLLTELTGIPTYAWGFLFAFQGLIWCGIALRNVLSVKPRIPTQRRVQSIDQREL